MKLLFENWRQYLNENLSKKEIEQAISDASFNSAQSSQHRWGRGQPIIDYTDTPDGRTYTATYPDGTENSDLWPSRESKPGEDLETFLKRVEEPIQLNLVENWRKFLNEEAKSIIDLPEDAGITMKWYPQFRGGSWLIFYSSLENPEDDPPAGPYGEIAMNQLGPEYGNAWQIHSEANKGWGPLLYDVAMEWGTKVGGGITSDTSVSDDAKKVWDYYLHKRSDEDGDVKAIQIGEPDQSSLTKRYIKNSTNLDALKKSGRLVIRQ